MERMKIYSNALGDRKTSISKNSTTIIRVACVGDSITELTNYPTILSRLLGKNYVIDNFGVSGAKVTLDSDSPYLYSEACRDATKFQPNIVVIMLGTNDAALDFEQYRGNFVEDYLTLLERFQSLASKPQVWVVKPPPIFADEMGLSIEAYDTEIIPAIIQVANKKNLPIIDVHSALQSPRFFSDGVHPNGEGAKLIADVVYRVIVNKN